MKDGRPMLLRKALEAVIDSLDATLRVQRWSGADAVPEPLVQSASLLLPRLGAADRLLLRKFVGAPSDESRMDAMTSAVRHLDKAYVEYRKRITNQTPDRDAAATALDAEVCDVKAAATRW
jgi:hypothetical protein